MSVLINSTWWVLCGALVVTLFARDPRGALASSARLMTRTPVLLLLAAAVTINIGARALLGQAVPGDFAQEVVGARNVGAGGSLYTSDVNEDVRAWLAEDPPRVPGWLPSPVRRWLQDLQKDGRNHLAAQAHPPTLLAAVAPLVLGLGPYAAYWVVTLASIMAAALAALALADVFAPAASSRERLLAVLMFASWQPVLATVRDGQPSMIIAALVILGWRELRQGRDVAGGLAIGGAAALKLYPLLLLVPLAVRRRRALAGALLCLGCAAGAAAAVAGAGVWRQYATAARVIARSFTDAPNNMSLVTRLASGVPVPATLGWVAYPVLGAAAVALTLWVHRHRGDATDASSTWDVEFAAFVTLSLVLSPVAWHHYVSMLALGLAVLARIAWNRGGRAGAAAVLCLALLLSLPDTAWRLLWQALPAHAALLASPGLAAVALWAALLASGSPAADAISAPAGAHTGR